VNLPALFQLPQDRDAAPWAVWRPLGATRLQVPVLAPADVARVWSRLDAAAATWRAVEVGARVGRAHAGLYRVTRFCEKPPLARARRFVASGRHLWNAGIFVWRADRILEELARHAPALSRAFAPWRRRASAAALARAYRRAPKLPIDKAVLERSDQVWTLPLRQRWSDVGSWASLASELGVRPGRSRVVQGEALLLDAGGNLVWPSGRQVVLLGVEGLAVIESADALLVARLDRSAELRRVVEELRARGRRDLL